MEKQIVEKLEIILKRFLKKTLKNRIFLHISLKTLTNHALNYRAFGRKTQMEILKILDKNSIEKLHFERILEKKCCC